MRKSRFGCGISLFSVIILLIMVCITPVCVSAEGYMNKVDYRDYLNQFEQNDFDKEINISPENLSNESVGAKVGTYNGKSAVSTSDESLAVFSFDVKYSGYYAMKITYCGIPNKHTSILRTVLINGKVPFDEAEGVCFSRKYKNETNDFVKDDFGDEVRPKQIEVNDWQTAYVYGSSGYQNNALKFYLKKGKNTVAFKALAEPMAISSITFCKEKTPVSYKEYIEKNGASKKIDSKPVKIQGEKALYKSSYSLTPISLNSSADMEPASIQNTVYNAIGGINWSHSGDWLTWDFEVDETGYYNLSMRLLQGGNISSVSSRDIYIDGEIPFAEFAEYTFPYEYDWYYETLGNKDGAYKIFLTKGKHTVTMRVTLGKMASIVQRLSDEVEELNQIYRSLLVIMGTNPDTYRDYQFNLYIPETIKGLKKHSDNLYKLCDELQEFLGSKTGDTQFLFRFAEQLSDMYKKENQIAKMYSSFQNNISTLADFVTSSKSLPLTVDYLTVTPDGANTEENGVGFFKGFFYEVKKFLISFAGNYSSFEGKHKEKVEVWIDSGRDQAQIIRSLSRNEFTAKSNIDVDLKLVPMGALLPAALADNCPDVALSLGASTIANYGFRGALVDLKDKINDEVYNRFSKSAWTPLTFDGKVYGLPETQSFYCMFYRTDIMNELGIEIPQTWDDMIEILPVLQKNSMNIGMPANRLHTLAIYMYQKDESIYNSKFTKTNIANNVAIESFSEITDLFSDYEVPQTINFVSKFRTGSIPIGIAEYTTYNTLEVSAPELSGVWEFAPIPGMRNKDGTIDRTSVGQTNGCVLMKKGKNTENGWKFIDWWTSSETQAEYGQEIENVLGSSARYASANIEAVSELPWIKSNYEQLLSIWKDVKGIPEIPGGYYMEREINFAFSAVVNNKKDVAEELNDAATEINKEIKSKRTEFGMPIEE